MDVLQGRTRRPDSRITPRSTLSQANLCHFREAAIPYRRVIDGLVLMLPGCVGSTLAGWRLATDFRLARQDPRCVRMAEIVLRVRLVSGDHLDVTFEGDGDEEELIERVVETLAEDSGVLRSSHGDRLMVVYGRGVAAVEMAPRGAVL
jgi:hypothetical protein